MAKKKRKNQSRLVDVCIGLLFSVLAGYIVLTAIQTFESKGDYVDVLLQFNDKVEWLKNANPISKIGVLVVATLSFILMVTMSSKKDSGYKDAAGHGAYGDAEFSDLESVRESDFIAPAKRSKLSETNALKTLEIEEGLILGREGDQLLVIHPDSALDNRNVLLVGSSGSAKGQAFVINNIINNKSESIVVTDPKGELFDLTADIKRDQGYKVINIDFLNLKGNRYNPLDYVENDLEAVKLANNISMNSAKDVKQDFFFTTAKDLLTGLIIYSKEEYPEPNISRTVKGLFNKISEDEQFLPELCERIGDSHAAYQYLKDAAAQTGNTRSSILSSFAQQTGVFSLGSVANLTEFSDFKFHDLQDQKTILYVKVPIKDNPVPALTSTFFDQLITTLYKIGDQNHSKLYIPTILLFDEFANLGKINDFDNTLSTCRGYGLSIITVVQDFAQLEGKYSKEIARMIINNHDTTLFLRTKDTETAKYFERLAGDTTIKFSTKSTSGSGGVAYYMGMSGTAPSRSTSEQYIKKPLISESLLLQMPTNKCFVFMPGHVIELEKAYQSKIFKDFITASKPVKKGANKIFPYTYPEHRDEYIKKFNLKPYESEESLHLQEPIIDKLDTSSSSEDLTTLENENSDTLKGSDEKEDKSNRALDLLVTSFMEELKTNKSESESVELELPYEPNDQPNDQNNESDSMELEIFQTSARLNEAEDKLKELQGMGELMKRLEIHNSIENQNTSHSINTEEESYSSDTDDISSELPI